MRSINELLGIIKGISFDGIINDKEVEKLEKWLAENRNLVYKTKHIEMISLLDNILEDHIITDEERNLLENKCNELRGINSKNSASFILQGILDGIISDGVINKKEIDNLKIWMDYNGESLNVRPKLIQLKNVIGEILNETEIDLAAENELIERLYAAIKEAQFEITKDYICNKVKNHENIGLDIIGLLSDKEAINKIHRQAEEKLEVIIKSRYTVREGREIIFVSLVLNAIMNYKEGRFYGGLKEIYESLYSRYTFNRIEGYVRSILDCYFNNDKNNRRSITSALCNAIVPLYYLEPFFEFIYDIYRVNFLYDIPNDLYAEFRFIYEGLRYKMVDNSDTLAVAATQKAYKLIASTKALILDEKNDTSMNSLIELSIIVIRLIDKHMWKKDIEIYNPYLKVGYEEWIKSLTKDDYSEKNEKKKSELYSRWEPRLFYKNNNIYLLPPNHKVKSCYGYENIKVEVINNGRILYENNYPDIREIIGGYEIISEAIKIDIPLGRLEYKITSGTDVIYSSKNNLYRNYIVFDSYGKELNNNTDYDGTSVLCLDKMNDSEDFEVIWSNEDYNVAIYNAHKGDVISIGSELFSFSSIGMNQIVGKKYADVFIFDEVKNTTYPVFSELNYLTFETTRDNAIYEINIDNVPYKLEAFNYLNNKSGLINKYIVDINGLINSGIHVLEVYEIFAGKRNKIETYKCVLDSALIFEVEKRDNYDDYIVLVESDLLEDDELTVITPTDYDPKWLEINDRGKVYHYILPLGIEYYMLTSEGENWKDRNDSIWIGDINFNSVLKIADTSIDKVLIYDDSKNLIKEDIELKDKKLYKELYVNTLLSYKNVLKYVDINLVKDDKICWNIRCYNRCVLSDELEAEYDDSNKVAKIIPVFEGKGKVKCIVSYKGKEVCSIDNMNSGEEYLLQDINPFKKYRIEFYERKLGLSLAGVKKLKEYEKVFFSWNDILYRSFKVSRAYYEYYYKNKCRMKKLDLKNTYIDIMTKLDNGVYLGKLYERVKDEYYHRFFKINPIRIEICSEIFNNSVEISLTKDGDGLLLDNNKNRILADLDDLNAADGIYYDLELIEDDYYE